MVKGIQKHLDNLSLLIKNGRKPKNSS